MAVNGDIWKYVATVAIGLAAGQAVPLVRSSAVSAADIRAIKESVQQLRQDMKDEAEETRDYVREQLGNHDSRTAHDGALHMLLEQGKALSAISERQEAHERRAHP